MYTLVYGAMPFDGSNFKRLVKQITTGDYYEPKSPSPASGLVRTMLTVSAEKRANIGDICSHWWVNEGYPQPCLDEAEYLASLTPVRLDLLLSLAPSAREEIIPGQEAQVCAQSLSEKLVKSIMNMYFRYLLRQAFLQRKYQLKSCLPFHHHHHLYQSLKF